MFCKMSMILLAVLLVCPWAAARSFMGNWEGTCTTKGWEGKAVRAQIVGTSGATYRAMLELESGEAVVKGELSGFRRGDAAVFVGEINFGEENGGESIVTADSVGGVMRGWVHPKGETQQFPITFEMKKVLRGSPTMGAQPPEGGIVLFDGTDLSGWIVSPGNPADGAMRVISASSFTCKQEFGSCLLHVEFRTPYMPDKQGQARGNSGVYVQGRYEVQVLDSYTDAPADNLCGAIYHIATPLTSACLPPTEWQTYDIEFHAPEFNPAGEKTKNAVITVKQNGVTIHDALELPTLTPGGVSNEEAATGPLFLQNHGDGVEYRNIWVVPLD